ncbi:MAG: transglycosylase SLT domain-containing protein, partial [Rhodanobacter sp.]|nr:transglycosylase SLT domain-containing protein [Rhodanobacter sp.]
MLLRSAVRSLCLAPLAVVFVLLAACASVGGAQPSTSVNPSASVNALYGQLDQASQGYEIALQQARAGDQHASQLTLSQSLDQLKQAAAACGNTEDCDPQRFFSVFDHLLRLKDGHFDDGPEIDGDVDATQAALATGKTGAASLPQAQRSVTLLRGQKLSELIAMNGAVKSALEDWLTWRRPNLIAAYVNYEHLRYQMWPQYQKADLPEALLFGIMAKESGGKVNVVSRSGAAGPLQFMYATGLRFGL